MAARPESKLVSDTTVDEIFDSLLTKHALPLQQGSLSVEDSASKKQQSPGRSRPPRPLGNNSGPGPAPNQARRPPPPGVANAHRPSRSQEDMMRSRRAPPRSGAPPAAGSPARRGDRSSDRTAPRPRRNSESSIIDRERPLTEEEKVLREARRLARMNTQKTKETGKKPNKRMDIIDQLDASSIFGMGIVHHDGPYDALNAHRNRGSSRRAPMRAFPKNSLNNSMGGSGPLNARPDHQTFMGNNDSDAFNDYSVAAPKADVPDGVFDPTSRGHIIHGDESLGLGSSTFLEGTPAARTIIQQKQAEDAEQIAVEGLKRQKSLAHRLRSVRRPNRNYPDGFKGATRKPSDAIPLPSRAGGMGENTPFIPEYDAEPESLTVRGKGGSSSPPQFRGRTMSDDVTSSNATSGGGGGGGGGILSRVKSLKGGRRNRSQTENYDPSMPMPNTTSHGTAV
ncbi:Protein pal1 [Ceratocystis lukuohia]